MKPSRESAEKKVYHTALLWLAAAAILMMGISCGGSESTQTAAPAGQDRETFTFFDLGRNSILTDDIRESLEDRLGSDAVEKRGTIDLEINFKGFLAAHFPALDALNRKLNFPPRERIEHDIIRLMYRYARNNGLPFKSVELVFSGIKKTPLYFKIFAEKEGGYLINTLKEKYGKPEKIEMAETSEQTLFWKQEKDTLMVSIQKDRFDDPIYFIMIYFGDNLSQLVEMEETAAMRRKTESKKAGKTVF